tara:strand:- start:293 stop:616 length:324 start_codon:yes stop_codon:yes gene_type:complete
MNRIQTYLQENYPDEKEILLADGFEDAFVGVVESFGSEPKACYDYDACIDILMEQMTPSIEDFTKNDEFYRDWHGEAVEFMEFNVTGAYVGEFTPAFIKLNLGEQKL